MNRSVNKAVDAPLPLAIISFQFIYGNSVQMKQKQTGRELAVGTHVCIKERKRERASDSDVGGGGKAHWVNYMPEARHNKTSLTIKITFKFLSCIRFIQSDATLHRGYLLR